MGKVGTVVLKDARDNATVAAWAIKSDSKESDEILELVTGELSDDLDGAQKSLGRRGVTFQREATTVRQAFGMREAGTSARKAAMTSQTNDQLLKEAMQERDPVTRAWKVREALELEKAVGDSADLQPNAIANATGQAIANAMGSGTDQPTARDQLQGILDGTAKPETIDWSPELDAQMVHQLHATDDPLKKEQIGYELTLKRLRELHRGERPY